MYRRQRMTLMANALVRTGYSATQLALHWLIALLLGAASMTAIGVPARATSTSSSGS